MKRVIAAAAAAALVPAAAAAEVAGSTSADLNLREGHGTNDRIVTTMPEGAPVVIDNCLEALDWCQVRYDGATGFASARYLLADAGGRTVVVTEEPSVVDLVAAPVEAVGEATGEIVGALGAAVGGVVGGVADAITPDPAVVTYVEENPVDPVYLEGEAVVGAGVPDAVVLHDVPQSRYRYATINDERVLVDPDTRRVVYVDR